MKEFFIQPNKDFEKKYNEIIANIEISNFNDKIRINNELNSLFTEILSYREKTFNEALEYLKKYPYDEAKIILNIDLENLIDKIFKKQREIFHS